MTIQDEVQGGRSKEPLVSIVVPTFRRPDALRETLAALLDLDYPRDRYEVIVIDDGGEPVTTPIIDDLRAKGLRVSLEAQEQLGAARARNRGARLAEGELLIFCDDDMIVEPSHLRSHLATRRRHGDVVVSGKWEFSPGVKKALEATAFGRYRIALEERFQAEAAGDPIDGDRSCLNMALLSAANLALRRELFWELGGFDETFPVAGAEDQDFSLRARAHDRSLILDTRIRCLHNDNRISLRSYCEREERSAKTMPVLARKYPSELNDTPYVRENKPLTAGDPPRLVAKKLVRQTLSASGILAALHRVTAALERVGAPEVALHRLYDGLLGLHLFRGFREAWRG